MRPDIRKIRGLIERLEREPYLQDSFLENNGDFFFFIGHHINDYTIEESESFKSLMSLNVIRDKRSRKILGYIIRPKTERFVFRKNYMLIYGSDENDAMYSDFTGFTGLQCYFNIDSVMLIASKVTTYYDNIESVL